MQDFPHVDDGVALSSPLETLKLEALDSLPVVKMFDGCNLAGKGALVWAAGP